MNIKNLLYMVVGAISIFASYYYVEPFHNKIEPLQKNSYNIETKNILPANTGSTFTEDEEEDGLFYISPGMGQASEAIFTFTRDMRIESTFYIKEGAKEGDIEFIIKKNGKEVEDFIVAMQGDREKSFPLTVKNGDRVSVIADQHGDTRYDWGVFEILSTSDIYKTENIVIPILWILFFIFLLKNGFGSIGLSTYTIFLLMLYAEKLNFGTMGIDIITTHMLFMLSIAFLLVFLYQELGIVKKYKPVQLLSFLPLLPIALLPLLVIIYNLSFGTAVTSEIMYAVYQTNGGEATEFLSGFIEFKYVFLILIFVIFLFLLLFTQDKGKNKIDKVLLVFLFVTLVIASMNQKTHFRISELVVKSYENYKKELALFEKAQADRKTNKIQFQATKKSQGETYVIIIGESLTRNHMGMYGYMRDTTPLLSKMAKKGELVVFDNTYSNHTVTTHTLSFSLTEANQYNAKKYYDSLSIVEIVKKANFESYWIAGQATYGTFQNLISVIARETDHFIPLDFKDAAKFLDGSLIKKVKKALVQKTDKNKVIFVHLLGSHYEYGARYPHDEFSVFTKPLLKAEFGNQAYKNTRINHYDNSIVYNDYVVSSIIEELKDTQGISGLLYMSDHGEEVIHGKSHNPTLFTFAMTQIPLIGWFSEEYKNHYPDKYNNLLNKTHSLFSNDMFYDTMIGLMGVKTDKYNAIYDLSSSEYKLKDVDALTGHGNIKYIDKANYKYWQKTNEKYLIDTNQSSRIIPHRINSLGMLFDMWNDGIRSFEFDAIFRKDGTFQTGHDKHLAGPLLEKYLDSIEVEKVERIWFDFKNLNKHNYKDVVSRLEYLDEKFGLKDKLIFESPTAEPFYKELREAGWHTSYYMPIGTIVGMLARNEKEEMEKLAVKIAKQIETQNVAAISFDSRLYPFVKRHLESKLPKEIVYHSWGGIPALFDTDFEEKLLKHEMYNDQRIKTIICDYESEFRL